MKQFSLFDQFNKSSDSKAFVNNTSSSFECKNTFDVKNTRILKKQYLRDDGNYVIEFSR